MILRRITEHLKAQNWFAVGLDFLIVVAGILIAFQINNWREGHQWRVSERAYLERLHSDIVELSERRAVYDLTRPALVDVLKIIAKYTNGYSEVLDLSSARAGLQRGLSGILNADTSAENWDSAVCNAIEWSAYLTNPPAALPTATELISAGRLDQIGDEEVKLALLSYLQQASRTVDYVAQAQQSVIFMATQYPDLIHARYDGQFEFDGGFFARFTCDYEAMRDDDAFLNALTINLTAYASYTNTAVLPVSEKLSLLHHEVDKALGIDHSNEAE